MSTRSKLKVGVDVPWVTAWSEEAMLGVGPCPTVGGRPALRQADYAGHGKPQYSLNHLRRQRESVARMLCPMCGEPTPAGDRYTETAKLAPAGVLRAKGLAHAVPSALPDERIVLDAGSIAPLHKACVDRSLLHCPHLRAEPDLEVIAFPARWSVAPLLVQVDAAPAPLALADPSTAMPRVAASFLQLCGVTEDTDRHWRRMLRTAA